jgi:hypothetical protein
MQEEQQEKEKPLLSVKDFILMLVVALFFDGVLALIQLIVVVGSVAASVFNVVPVMLFFIWFLLKGISFAKKKNSLSFFGATLIEFIPVVNALPAWTAEVVTIYIMQKKDAILAKAAGLAGGAAGASSVLSVAAKTVGAKEVGKNLKETSEKLKEKSEEYKSRMTPTQNNQTRPVGGEITTVKANKEYEPNNIVPFPTKEKAPFSNSKKEVPHDKKWIYPNEEAA